jgi:hypothetical protein
MNDAKQASPLSNREKLEEYLTEEIQKHRIYSMAKRVAAWALLLAATIAGGLVVVNVGTKWFDADQLSALTGIGAALLALLRWAKFQEQAKWNKLKQRKLEGFYRQLMFEGADERTISAELTKTMEELERMRAWLQIPGEMSELVPNVPRQG